MTVFVILAASPDDLPRIASLQFNACVTDPGFCTLYPLGPTGASLVHLTRQYEDLLDEDATAYLMIARETLHGEIVSYAVWHFVPPRDAEDVEEEMLADVHPGAFPPGADVEIGSNMIKNSTRKRNEVVTECFGVGKPYVYLAAMGTTLKYQRQGAASKLVEWAVERADDKCLPVYVESTPAAIRLYEKFGFREYDQLQIPLGSNATSCPTNTCMLRLPNTD